jgi:hypothetical protein
MVSSSSARAQAVHFRTIKWATIDPRNPLTKLVARICVVPSIGASPLMTKAKTAQKPPVVQAEKNAGRQFI